MRKRKRGVVPEKKDFFKSANLEISKLVNATLTKDKDRALANEEGLMVYTTFRFIIAFRQLTTDT